MNRIEVCHHGSVAHKCEICELYTEIDKLRFKIMDHTAEIQKLRAKLRWIPFDYADTDVSGIYWFRINRQVMDVDTDHYGNLIAVPTGQTEYLTVLGELEWNDAGRDDGHPELMPSLIEVGKYADLLDDCVITHYAEVLPPAAPEQEPQA